MIEDELDYTNKSFHNTLRRTFQNSLKHGIELLEYAKLRNTVDVECFNIYLRILASRALPQKCEEVLKEMQSRNIEPNGVSYNLLMRAYLNNNQYDEAVYVLARMTMRGLKPDRETFSNLLIGYAYEGKIKEAFELAEKSHLNEKEIYRTIIKGLTKKGHLQDAQYLVKESKVDITSVMKYFIQGWLEKKNFNNAWNILQALKEHTPLKDNIFTKFIKFAIQNREYFRIDSILEEMEKCNVKHTIYSLNHVMQLYFAGKMVDKAEKTIECILKSYYPNIYTFNIMIDGYLKNNNLKKAEESLELMKEYKIDPCHVTYNMFIDYYVRNREIQKAMQVLDEMIGLQLPIHGAVASILYGYVLLGDINAAEEFFNECLSDGIEPTVFMVNNLLEGYYRKGLHQKANQFLMDMHTKYNIQLNAAPISTMFKFATKKGVDKAKDSFETIKKQGYQVNHSYSILIRGLCEEGRIDEAKSYFLEMLEKNEKPTFPSFVAFVRACQKYASLELPVELFETMKKYVEPSAKIYSQAVWLYLMTNKEEKIAPLLEEMEKKKYKIQLHIIEKCIYHFLKRDQIEKAKFWVQKLKSYWRSEELFYKSLKNILLKI